MPVDPEFAYDLWISVFTDSFEGMKIGVSDALESDFYWIDSIDRAIYDADANRIVFDATISFETVYANDPQEWRSDTWELFQSWSRDAWASFVEAFDTGNSDGYFADWPRYTPAVRLFGNAGRLTAECPGSLIYRVSQRDAAQTEFLAECSFHQ